MNIIKAITTSFLFIFSDLATASAVNNLALPLIYDNIGGAANEYGQTFTSDGGAVSEIRVYIGDPTRPNEATVNELVGPAELVLYDASNLLTPIELGRNQVLSGAESASGLVTFLFSSPIPTTQGHSYFFSISAPDSFGIGLTGFSSTYTDGSEAWRSISTGEITLVNTGRDLSFLVTTVPTPSAVWLFLSSLITGVELQKRKAS